MEEVEEKIKLKAERIRRTLVAWVKREGILLPGEKLVFTLGIESAKAADSSGPAENAETEKYLAMAPEEFFTASRFSEVGATPRQIGRALSALANWESDENGSQDMRQFLRRYPRISYLRGIQKLKIIELRLVAAVLREANLPIEDDIEIVRSEKYHK